MKLVYQNVEIAVKKDGGEIFFQSPITGAWYRNISQALAGWSEQNSQLNQQWDELVKKVKANYNDWLYWLEEDEPICRLD